jgi:5-methylcytosine-specific restriction protein B
MAQYFTSEHFKLLKKWQTVKYDKTNPEQQRVCEELKRAYAVTEAWAKALQKRLFPAGRIAVRKWPISQGQKFFGYNE